MPRKFKLFSDNDGVKADFIAGFHQQFGREFDKIPLGVAWGLIGKKADFYEHLPLMSDAVFYWNSIKKYDPTILTGAPTAKFDAAKQAKLAWKEKHNEVMDWHETEMIVCFSKDKPLHMVKADEDGNEIVNILIDDHQKNITKWEAAGGVGILFVTAHQAVADLEALLAKLAAE